MMVFFLDNLVRNELLGVLKIEIGNRFLHIWLFGYKNE